MQDGSCQPLTPCHSASQAGCRLHQGHAEPQGRSLHTPAAGWMPPWQPMRSCEPAVAGAVHAPAALRRGGNQTSGRAHASGGDHGVFTGHTAGPHWRDAVSHLGMPAGPWRWAVRCGNGQVPSTLCAARGRGVGMGECAASYRHNFNSMPDACTYLPPVAMGRCCGGPATRARRQESM